MNELVLIKSTDFDGIAFDCYVEPTQQDKGDFWATRTQIGQLLEYENPRDAIKDIHDRHRGRIDKFSTQRKLRLHEENRVVTREVTVYSFKGLLEICRYSNQSKADAVIDWLWNVVDEIRKTGSYLLNSTPAIPTNAISEGAILFERAGLKGNQLMLALDKLYKSYTGKSALQAIEMELIAPKTRQQLTPTQIGERLGIKARQVNALLAGAGYQHKIADRWEALEPGLPYAVMLDVGKAHSDGTPICQLKWCSDILPIVEQLMEEDCA